MSALRLLLLSAGRLLIAALIRCLGVSLDARLAGRFDHRFPRSDNVVVHATELHSLLKGALVVLMGHVVLSCHLGLNLANCSISRAARLNRFNKALAWWSC